MPDIVLPTPGEDPNWAPKLNTAIRAINEEVDNLNSLTMVVQNYGVIGDGRPEDSAAFQAVIDAAPAYATITGEPGGVYKSAGWVINKPLTIDMPDSHFIKTTDEAIFTAEGAWENIQTVSSVSGTLLSGVNTTNFKVGDLVKVYADDVIWDARQYGDGGGEARVGEFRVISQIDDATNMRVNPPLRETYTTGIRVARLQNRPINIRFGTATYEGSGLSGGMIRLRALNGGTFEGQILKGPSAAFTVGSCYGTRITARIGGLPRSSGYGVYASGAVNCFFDIQAFQTRHAFSDGPAANQIPAGHPDPTVYGRTENNTITGFAMGSWETAYDCHHGSVGNRFVNCVAHGVFTSGAPGFGLRGRNHRLINCEVIDTSLGYKVFNETNRTGHETWGTSEGHIFINCVSRGTFQGILFELSDYKPASRGANLTIMGGHYESNGSWFMYGSRCRVRFQGNPVFRSTSAKPMGSEPKRLFQWGHVDLTGDLTIDLSGFTEADLESIMYFADTGTTVTQADLDVHVDISEYGQSRVGALAEWNTLRGEINWTSNRIITATILSKGVLEAYLQRSTYRGLNSGAIAASSSQSSVALSAGGAISLGKSADPVVYVTMTNTVAAGITSGAIATGSFAGQMIVLYNSSGSAGPITIPNGSAFNTQISSNRVIPVGEAIRLAWDGGTSRWRMA